MRSATRAAQLRGSCRPRAEASARSRVTRIALKFLEALYRLGRLISTILLAAKP